MSDRRKWAALGIAGASLALIYMLPPASRQVSTEAGVPRATQTEPARVFLPVITRQEPSIDPGTAVLVGAGDIAGCGSEKDEKTATLLDSIGGTVFTAGDNAYPNGTDMEFTNCYEPTWGRHKARTRPAPGNHDYHVPGASGYFNYFGAAAGEADKGYYSYDMGDWHIIALNSECTEVGGCGIDSPQGQWLQSDLVANPSTCTLGYWHRPRFSSGSHHGGNAAMQDFWQLLYDSGADIVLNGHEHNYERFALQDPNGVADLERGIRQFVVGTGGKGLYPFGTIQPNSEIRKSDTYGVLKLTLYPTGYDWEFIPIAGMTFTDSGSALCVVAPPTATISAPADGATFDAWAAITFTGSASDAEDGDVTASLVWVSSIDGEIGTGRSFSGDDLSVGTHAITATAKDSGGLTGSDQITITMNAPPTATISAPADGATFAEGEAITFGGSTSDAADGDVTAGLSRESSLDGPIGSGGSFSRSDLSVGVHTIIATATDSGGLTDTDSVSITIFSDG